MNCLITNNQHTIAVLSLFFLLGLAACGDSSSSSDSGTPDDSISDDYTDDGSSEADSSGKGSSKKDDPFLDSKEYKDSSVIGSVINSGMGLASVRTDSYKDYKTIRFGAYEWMAENIKINDEDYEFSICYNDNEKNCDIYGSLLPDSVANSVCPYLFRLPTVDDFKYLVKFAGDVTSQKFGFNPQYAGICRKTDKTLTCSDIRNALNLASSENSYFHLSPSGNVVYAETKDNEYYSVRCLRSSSFVENENFLPACNSQWENELLYVASEKKNFVCKNNGWVKDTSDKCSYLIKGQKEYANDTLYICDGRWRIAELNDLNKPCSKSNEWEIAKLNGTNYICRAQFSDVLQWEKIRGLEAELGVCTPKNNGARDSLINATDTSIYVCEDSTWRRAEPKDYHDCNKSKLAETVVFEGKTYVCRDSEKWSKLTDNEVMFGVCTTLQLGKLDTLYHVTGNREEYFVCDTSSGWSDYPAYWRTARIGDYYECNESNMYKVVRYNEQQIYGCNKKLQWEQVSYPVSSIGYCYEEIRNTIKVTYLNFSYICDTVWRSATIDEGLGACTATREGERAPFNIYYYICQKGSWEQIEELEYYLGICDSSTREKIAVKEDSVHYVCRASGWVEASIAVIYGKCDETNYGRVVNHHPKNGGAVKLICRDKSEDWQSLTDIETLHGICTPTREGDTLLYKDTIYECSAYKWKRVALDKTLGKCDSTIYGNTGTIGAKKYICSANGWIPYDPLIDALGVCQKSIQGTIKTYNGKEYGCGYNNENSQNKYEWVEESEITDSLGFCLGDKFEWKIYKGKDYSCRYGQVAWKNSSFWGMYLACDNTKYGITVGYEGQHYYCDASLPDSSDATHGWHAITPMDSTIGICRREIHLDTATYLGKQYYCGLQEEGCGWRQEMKCYTWIPVTATE